MRRRLAYWVVGLGWLGGLTMLSFLPGDEKHALHTHGRLHSPGHFLAFFITAVVLLRIPRTAGARVWMMLVLALLPFGFEYGQSVLDGYGIEWHDVIVDLLGATLGAVLYSLVGGMRDRSMRPRRSISRWGGLR